VCRKAGKRGAEERSGKGLPVSGRVGKKVDGERSVVLPQSTKVARQVKKRQRPLDTRRSGDDGSVCGGKASPMVAQMTNL